MIPLAHHSSRLSENGKIYVVISPLKHTLLVGTLIMSMNQFQRVCERAGMQQKKASYFKSFCLDLHQTDICCLSFEAMDN